MANLCKGSGEYTHKIVLLLVGWLVGCKMVYENVYEVKIQANCLFSVFVYQQPVTKSSVVVL